jgi:hypothetical protein
MRYGVRRGDGDTAPNFLVQGRPSAYRRAPNTFTFQMIYRQGHEFPGFSQIIYWGPTRVSGFSKYSSKWFTPWFTPRLRFHTPSHLIIVKPPTPFTPPRALPSHPHARHVTSCGSSGARDAGPGLPFGRPTVPGPGGGRFSATPPHEEVEEAPLPGRPVGLDQFRPFPKCFYRPELEFLRLLTIRPIINY